LCKIVERFAYNNGRCLMGSRLMLSSAYCNHISNMNLK
jgi:hypothetical protein